MNLKKSSATVFIEEFFFVNFNSNKSWSTNVDHAPKHFSKCHAPNGGLIKDAPVSMHSSIKLCPDKISRLFKTSIL